MNAILLHGTGGSNIDYFWFADTQKYLKSLGYNVWWPALPNTDSPTLDETKKYLLENMPVLSEQDVIITHSSGCPLILNLLQDIEVRVKQVILVAGYYRSISDASNGMLPPRGFNWPKIKLKSEEFIFINSDKDPWKCTDEQAREPAGQLDSPLIVNFGQGHMGSGAFNQPMPEFPLLKRLIKVPEDIK